MFTQITLDPRVDRSAGETRLLPSASAGIWVTAVGAVPQDLALTFISALGAPSLQRVAIAAGDRLFVHAREIVVYHAPLASIASGVASFDLVLTSDTDRFETAARNTQLLYRVGPRANDVVPARVPTLYLGNLSITGDNVAARALYVPPSTKALRILKYRVVVPGNWWPASAGVATQTTVDIREGLGTVFGAHTFFAPASQNPGIAFDTGVIDLGDGRLFASAGNGVAGSINVLGVGCPIAYYIWANEEG